MKNFARILIAVGILNFFAFAAASIYLGGDAVNGYQKDGHYFLVKLLPNNP